ncbi:hypothetical protein M3Y95_00847300 [Aphelenchoides besseyi]|nr:hypothetical protein M3Y95_00847300 [Aphelenchoides besseyi]
MKVVVLLIHFLNLAISVVAKELKSIDVIFSIDYNGVLNSGNFLLIQIGTPTQSFIGIVFPYFHDLIVIDSECGVTNQNCSSICYDPFFSKLYCEVSCQQLTPQDRNAVCGVYNHFTVIQYNRSASTTSRTLTERGLWNAQRNRLRKMSAIHVEDVLVFQNSSGHKLTIQNFTFLSQLFSDFTIFSTHQALIGFAPGSTQQPNFFYDLYRRRILEEPVVSFSNIDVHSQGIATIGRTNRFNCTKWIELSTINQNSWLFEFENVEVMGVSFGKTRVLWNTLDTNINVPVNVLKMFVQRGILVERSKNNYLIVNCSDTRPYVRFVDSMNQELLLRHTDLFIYVPFAHLTYCSTYILPTEEQPSNYAIEWSIGAQFAGTHCHVYDFENKKLSIGLKRT